MTQTSFLGSIGSGNSGGPVSPVFALRYILRYQPITSLEISTTNSDGTLRVNLEAMAKEKEQNSKKEEGGNTTARGKKKKIVVQGEKSNAMKIQVLLDQRKPPTEKLPSLCEQYDDDLGLIAH